MAQNFWSAFNQKVCLKHLQKCVYAMFILLGNYNQSSGRKSVIVPQVLVKILSSELGI